MKCLEKYVYDNNHSKIIVLIIITSDKVNLYIGTHKWRPPQWPRVHHKSTPKLACVYGRHWLRKPK